MGVLVASLTPDVASRNAPQPTSGTRPCPSRAAATIPQRRLITWMIAIPPLQVHGLVADGQCERLAVSANGWSSRTNDHARIVTGP